MEGNELRRLFLKFFEEKGHVIVPSSSLIPDDPSVLLTTAGMQQFKPYYTGQADPFSSPHPSLQGKPLGSLNAASCQKSFRTSDIDEVGDERHLTFFEMLGNFSFGGYFKEEAITLAYDFLHSIGLAIEYVTVFQGDEKTPKDEESKKIWEKLLVKDIREAGREDNFWGPTGKEGPCGPATEIYIQGTEIWNIVFNEYHCNAQGQLEPLKTPGVDTGMGLERLAMVSQKTDTIFETDLFDCIMKGFPEKLPMRVRRIIVDHARAIAFLVSDGLKPSNKGADYILRRLIRRVIGFAYDENIGAPPEHLFSLVVEKYKTFPDYKNLDYALVQEVYKEEYAKFIKTIAIGRRKFEEEANRIKARGEELMPPVFVFDSYQSTGTTIDVLEDFARKEGVKIDRDAFEKDLELHKEVSRAGKERKFGGHGLVLDTGELKATNEEELQIVTRLHTATHLLQAALRRVLGDSVHQAGSDITPERTRFDFTFDRKLSDEEVKKVEELMNGVIRNNMRMEYKEMPFQEAVRSGALYSLKETYPAIVKVYSVFDEKTGEKFSSELCGGPHVSYTGEIGKFRIAKQEAVGQGVRRIRGVVS